MKQDNQKKPTFKLENDGSFVIENYNQTKSFSSFFPGIAGLYGIPMWAFYVNRGQGIAAFGVKNKNQSIMEFYPANNAYSFTPSLGFRTFIKVKNKSGILFYEPFKITEDQNIRQSMIIKPHEMSIEDENSEAGIRTKVTYFTLPNEPLAALVRITEFTNLSKEKVDIEVIDGMPKIMPYWVDQWVQKFMSNTAQAWVKIENAGENTIFYRLKVEINDVPEVHELTKGNFFIGAYGSGEKLNKTKVIVDPKIIFNEDSSYSYPFGFFKNRVFQVPKSQYGENKYPCALNYADFTIMPKAKQTMYSAAGHIDSVNLLKDFGKKLIEKSYFDRKRSENRKIIDSLTDDIYTKSNARVFDLYARQTYLDNLMRGGKPIVFSEGENKSVFYVYSRKHGDLERDYNNFELSPHYYSQGNGNYRDMNQNKRNDISFNPNIGDFNVECFYNLVQLDGYNPLVVKGQSFFFDIAKEENKKLLSDILGANFSKSESFFSKTFEPGALAWFLEQNQMASKALISGLIPKILSCCKKINE